MTCVDLSGSTAIVTGGGQGIGASIAGALTGSGASVVVNYFKDRDGRNLKRAKETAESLGEAASFMEADVRAPEAARVLFDRVIERFGRVDILINNAGIIRDRTVRKMSNDEWQQVIDTNLTGTFNLCREAARRMAEGGRIVNISSISGRIGFFGQANYAASKAGIVGLTRTLSRELAGRRIRVNAVAPGLVLTEMGLTTPQDVRDRMLESIPMGRFAEPEEIAGVVLFLCSDLSSYVTGQVIHVNGGWIGSS
jgi:3-oxoacyl-[acyl-carrier protein] reductase